MICSHIIPKFYLEQFATPQPGRKDKPGRIWVYERNQEPDERATSVQGREKGYFAYLKPDGTLEESFERVLADCEDECNEVLVCAKFETFHWPYGSREKLAAYAALLFSRATQRREFAEKNWYKTLGKLREEVADDTLVKKLAEELSGKLGTVVTVEAMRSDILSMIEKSQARAEAKYTFLSDVLQNAEYITKLLLKKQPWRVLRPPDAAEFVTTDNPLITFVPLDRGLLDPGYGFRKDNAVAAFPLAPSACLVMGNAWPVPGTLDAETLMGLNQALISICGRYVYSRTRSAQVHGWVQKYANSCRYGENAFAPIGLELPIPWHFVRRHFGLDPD